MKLKFTLMAGVATAALSGAMMTSALAADDQVEETRALNLQALADARSQNGSTGPRPMPMPKPPESADDAGEADGQGGPSFDGPPGPNDMGTDTGDWEDDEADAPADALPPDDVE